MKFLAGKHRLSMLITNYQKNVGIINKLRYYLNINMLKQLYYTLIYPYLSYGVMSWGNTYPTKLTKIQTKQNKCIRNIFFANSKEKAIPYFKLLEIIQLYNIKQLKVAILTYKILVEKEVPSAYSNYLIPAIQTHSYNTRFASQLNIHRPKVRTNYGIHTFKYISSQLWESINVDVKRYSKNLFKKSHKVYLFYILKINYKYYLRQLSSA